MTENLGNMRVRKFYDEQTMLSSRITMTFYDYTALASNLLTKINSHANLFIYKIS